MTGVCTVPECGKPEVKMGWCHAHYSRWSRHGDPLITRTAPKTKGVSRRDRAAWLTAYKLAQGCADCGYDEHPAALDFDHRPGEAKVRDIKAGNSFGWAALQAEVAKCDVVCANCHRIRTFNRNQEVESA